MENSHTHLKRSLLNGHCHAKQQPSNNNCRANKNNAKQAAISCFVVVNFCFFVAAASCCFSLCLPLWLWFVLLTPRLVRFALQQNNKVKTLFFFSFSLFAVVVRFNFLLNRQTSKTPQETNQPVDLPSFPHPSSLFSRASFPQTKQTKQPFQDA